jgi:hypothetical protein
LKLRTIKPSRWIHIAAALGITAICLSAPLTSLTSENDSTTSTNGATRTGATRTVVANDGDAFSSNSGSGANLSSAVVKVASKSTYVLPTTKLASGRTAVVRWNPCQAAITYRVNLAGIATAKRAGMLKTIASAFAQLAAADGMTYSYQGSTTFVPQTGNASDQPAQIVVAAVSRTATDLPLTANSLGYGGIQWITWSGSQGEGVAVVRGYVVLNTSPGITTLKAGFGPGETQGNVVLHELGHATGLEHAGATGEQMNATLTAASPNGYADGDQEGLRQLGVKAGCIRIPSTN